MDYRHFITVIFVLLECSCGPIYVQNQRDPGAVSSVDPASLTYMSSWRVSGEVTLTDGVFREKAAPGSATEFVVHLSDWRAFNKVEGEETGAVILVTQAGGTGSFYDLALLTRNGHRWVNSDVLSLGDRVVIHSLAIHKDEIVVEMTSYGPQDPMCCPSQRIVRHFAIKAGKLVAKEGDATSVPAHASLVGATWLWVRSSYNDDSKSVPPRPEEYTVIFNGDGTINVKADCNLKGGTYRVNGQTLNITIAQSTMAACPEGSLENLFIRDLNGAAVWFIKDDSLYLDIMFDTGTMQFRQLL